jgi:FAD-dependent oxidoreductase domain-containing protein 1
MQRRIIIGGGVVGSSTAYHLAMQGLADDVVVLEPDPTYEFAATPRSTGGVRVLFTTPENIRMSHYGHAVYGDFENLTAVDGESVNLGLKRRGYLYMCQGREHCDIIESNWKVQTAEGANALLIGPEEIAARYPSLEVGDVDLAVFSPDDATIDPYAAVMGFRNKARSLGVTYRKDRAVGLEVSGTQVRTVTLESGETLTADWVVNAANCHAPPLCAMVGMPVPVAPMRRMTFYFECQTELEDLPLLRHLSGGGFRPEGRGYICGVTHYDEPRGFNWDVDHEVFEEELWPALARRVKAFEAVKVQRSWSGHYDQNDLDGNHIIGNWPGKLDNFLIACGLSGHGLMHAPAIGRALTELIIHGAYQTLDLSRFGYQRIIDNEPLYEVGPRS